MSNKLTGETSLSRSTLQKVKAYTCPTIWVLLVLVGLAGAVFAEIFAVSETICSENPSARFLCISTDEGALGPDLTLIFVGIAAIAAIMLAGHIADRPHPTNINWGDRLERVAAALPVAIAGYFLAPPATTVQVLSALLLFFVSLSAAKTAAAFRAKWKHTGGNTGPIVPTHPMAKSAPEPPTPSTASENTLATPETTPPQEDEKKTAATNTSAVKSNRPVVIAVMAIVSLAVVLFFVMLRRIF